LSALCCVLMSGCEKYGDTSIVGTFVYRNGYTGSMRIYERYEFKSNGSVYHASQIGNTSEFNTDGCSLYYTLDQEVLTIYHGTKGWKKEVRNTVYKTGQYFEDYILIGDKRFEKQ